MIVVTVARKPCTESTVAANVLRHQCGALGIDGTRVGYEAGEVDFTRIQRQQSLGDGSVNGAFGATALIGKEIATYKPGGRWPSNTILSHLPECRKVGTKTEPGFAINRFTDGMKPFGEGAGHAYVSEVTPDISVPVWECGAGCPVVDLDGQSGDRPVSGAAQNGTPAEGGGYAHTWGTLGSQGNGKLHKDNGGASRYFKQFGGQE